MTEAAQGIVDKVVALIIQPIVSLLFAVGFLVFMWGLVEFIANPTNDTKKTKGKKHMMYGVLGLFIMVSIWGIVGLVTNTIGIDCANLRSGQPCEYTGR